MSEEKDKMVTEEPSGEGSSKVSWMVRDENG